MTRPTLRLAIQYASTRSTPGRAQVRRWVASALAELVDSSTNGVDRIDSATLTVRFVDEAEGRSLNRGFRGKDYATNVLTFPMQDDPATVEADIVICMPVVEAEARGQDKPVLVHCAHLVVHGVLHACGFDHEGEADAEAMEDLERAVLARFGITDPYRVVAEPAP